MRSASVDHAVDAGQRPPGEQQRQQRHARPEPGEETEGDRAYAAQDEASTSCAAAPRARRLARAYSRFRFMVNPLIVELAIATSKYRCLAGFLDEHGFEVIHFDLVALAERCLERLLDQLGRLVLAGALGELRGDVDGRAIERRDAEHHLSCTIGRMVEQDAPLVRRLGVRERPDGGDRDHDTKRNRLANTLDNHELASAGDLAKMHCTATMGPWTYVRSRAPPPKLAPHDAFVRMPFRRIAGAQCVLGRRHLPRAGNRAARLFAEPQRREFPGGGGRSLRRRRAHRSLAAGHRYRSGDRRARHSATDALSASPADRRMSRVAVPYLQLDASGNIGEDRASVSREGIGDTKLRLAVNLIGGPAMTPREFAQREPQTTLGFSVSVNVPTGEYDDTKLVNLGTNRWAAKTEFGLTHPVGKWLLEAYAGAWWFDDNDNFFGGQLREQDPLASIQAHVSYTFKPRLWMALNTTYYEGGQTTVNGVDQDGPPVQFARRRDVLHAGGQEVFAQVQLEPRRHHAHRQQLHELRRRISVRLDGQAAPLSRVHQLPATAASNIGCASGNFHLPPRISARGR